MRNLGKCLGVRCCRLMGVFKRSLRSAGKCLGVFILCGAATGFAAPKTLLIGTGDCSEEAFLQNMELLTNIAQRRDDVDLIQLTPLFEKRKLLAPKQTQEEQRVLEAVHSKILLEDYTAAYKDIEEVLEALEKSVPSFESWQLIAKALAMKGFALSKQKKARFSEEAFMAILKLDSNYQLDHFIFPPTVVQNFERLRETLSKRKKAALHLTSSPGGAMVFVNGAPLGQTPLESELLPGHYRIVLEKEGKVSSPLTVSLGLGSPMHLDIPFPWEAAWRTPLCIQEEDSRIALNSKQMAQELGADYLVKVDTFSVDSKERGMRAMLLGLRRDEKIREGGILLEDNPQEAHLEKLIHFIISGKLERGEEIVVPLDKQGRLIHPRLLEPLPGGDKALAGKPTQGMTVRIASWVLIGTGSALGLGGGLAYAHSLKPASDMKEILKRYGSNEEVARNSRDGAFYKAALSRKRDRQKTAIVLGTSGVVSLATGLVLFFALPPKAEAPPRLSFAPHFGTDGGGVSLMGSF